MFTLAFSIKKFEHYLKCKNTMMVGIQEHLSKKHCQGYRPAAGDRISAKWGLQSQVDKLHVHKATPQLPMSMS